MRIAFQGAAGAYSESAALGAWPRAEVMGLERFEDVFDAVDDGRASHGILPVENSVGGSIHRNYDLLLERGIPIVAETELAVVHNLLVLPGTPLPRVRRVLSHPQALAQCERFLRSLANVEVVATYDTAGSARLIRDQQLADTAAVASTRAAAIFGLEVVREAIQDYPENVTRFVLIGADPTPLGPSEKTTLAFALHNEPGALFKALSVFALRGIDLTKLESRPDRGKPWEYVFYVDLAIGRDDPRCGRAIEHLAEFGRWVKELGSYPTASRARPGSADAPSQPPT